MLRISDANKIAITKFKAKKTRSAISALLVSIVFFAVCVFVFSSNAFLVSLKDVSLKGLNGKNLVFVANRAADINRENLPEEVFEIAKTKYKAAKAKDDLVENPVYFDSYYNKNRLKDDSKITLEAINEYLDSHFPKTNRQDFDKLLANYKIKRHFPKTNLTIGDSRLGLYIDGKEDIDAYIRQNDTSSLAGYFSSLRLVKMNVEEIFPIDKSKLQRDEVPILVNYSQAFNIAGIKKLTSNNQSEIFKQSQEVRNKAIGKSFSLCWRNGKSVEAVRQALFSNQQSDSEIKYEIDKVGCSSPKIVKGSDPQFSKNINQLKSRKVTFRVIGVIPDFKVPETSKGLVGLLNGFSVSTIDNFSSPANAPVNILTDNLSSEMLEIFKQPISPQQNIIAGPIDDIVEFESRDEMNRFINEVHCEENYCGKDKTLGVNALSDNYKVIDEINDLLNKTRAIVSIVAMALASVVVYLTVNKVMIDSRKESAIFRAIGYSRMDIAQIYLSYIAIFSLIVTVLVNGLLFLASIYIGDKIEPEVSLYFSNLFMTESVNDFHIFSYNLNYFGLFIPIFGVGVLASIVPLMINSRRSPLKNLRTE